MKDRTNASIGFQDAVWRQSYEPAPFKLGPHGPWFAPSLHPHLIGSTCRGQRVRFVRFES
jgi:hypothetical protein